MRTKVLAFLMAVCLLAAVWAAPVSANTGFIPFNYDYWIEHNSIGTPELHMITNNQTNKTISAFEILVYPKDAYGRSLSAYDWGNDYVFEGIAQELDDSDVQGLYWTLYGYDNATDNTTVTISSVLFTDGTTWYNSGYNYEEADFEILNDVTASGAYLVDSNRTVELIETSYSSYARDWYIWNDAYGWVWFSDDMAPDCSVWSAGTTIKLVINNNPYLYKIKNVVVQPETSFSMSFRNSQETGHSSNKEYFYVSSWSDGEAAANPPYVLDLWDDSEAYTRDWYVWNDVYGWVWFSGDRAAVCQLWREGDHSIMLIPDGDWSRRVTAEFHISVY